MTEETRLLWSVLKNWILSIMKALNLREISVPVSGASSSDNIDKPQAKHDSKRNQQRRPGSSCCHQGQADIRSVQCHQLR